jgi:hypothetical protein
MKKLDKLIADLTYTDVMDIEVGTEFACVDGEVLLASKSKPHYIPERRHQHPELRRQIDLAGAYEVIAPAVDVLIPASVEGVFDVDVMTDELRASRRPKPVIDPLREMQDEIAYLMSATLPEPEAALAIDLSEQADPVEEVVGPLAALKAKIDAVRAGTQELTPDELISMHRDDPPGAAAKLEDAVRALKGEARRKLNELMNVELADSAT